MSGILMAGLIGGIGGYGKGMALEAGREAETEQAIKKTEAAEAIKEKYRQQAEVMAEERARKKLELTDNLARESANKGLLTRMTEAEKIYREAPGMSEADRALGLAEVERVRKSGVEPSWQDKIDAGRKTGLIGYDKALDLERRDEETAYSRSRDTKKDAMDEKELALREKQVNASISNAAQAAADAAESRADKKALRQAYKEYGTALVTNEKYPGTMNDLIIELRQKITALGGNVNNMDDALLGKQITGKEKKSTIGDDGTETSIERQVTLGRTGGVLPQRSNTASNRPPPTAEDIAATAKKYGMTEQQVKDRLGIK